MKKFQLLTLTGFVLLGVLFTAMSTETKKPTPMKSIYDYSIKSLTGDTINLADFKGKKILFVNVASKCGFTPQYEGLQKLHEQYKNQMVIIGLPCNQFGEQESGTKEEIKNFCQKNYGVEFLITEKIEVKGEKQHPIYGWLTSKELNGEKSSSVKWNFQKYMVDENGNYVDYWYSMTKPESKKITKYLD